MACSTEGSIPSLDSACMQIFGSGYPGLPERRDEQALIALLAPEHIQSAAFEPIPHNPRRSPKTPDDPFHLPVGAHGGVNHLVTATTSSTETGHRWRNELGLPLRLYSGVRLGIPCQWKLSRLNAWALSGNRFRTRRPQISHPLSSNKQTIRAKYCG